MRIRAPHHLRADTVRFVLRVLLLAALPAALVVATALGMLADKSARANAPSKEHQIVILIDSDDEKVMGHAISYSMNISRAYAVKNDKVRIEIVANGAGIKLFRADTSPLRRPLAMLKSSMPDVVFSMCDSSRRIAEQKEGHAIELIPDARLVPFGVGRIVELQEAGWSYIHG